VHMHCWELESIILSATSIDRRYPRSSTWFVLRRSLASKAAPTCKETTDAANTWNHQSQLAQYSKRQGSERVDVTRRERHLSIDTVLGELRNGLLAGLGRIQP
jgi:hypothetical protein